MGTRHGRPLIFKHFPNNDKTIGIDKENLAQSAISKLSRLSLYQAAQNVFLGDAYPNHPTTLNEFFIIFLLLS